MKMTTALPLSRKRLCTLLSAMPEAKVGFLGDLCVDIYWTADMRQSELSRETPHYPLPVVSERYSLGAGGNVCANLGALGVKGLRLCGVLADDWRGSLVSRCLQAQGFGDSALLLRPGKTTNAYCKPLRKGISDVIYEDPRLDFTGEPLTSEEEDALLARLHAMAQEISVLCVSDQFAHGCVTGRVREAVCALGAQGLPVVADSRDRIGLYHHITLKPNEVEGVRAAAAVTGTPAESYSGMEGYLAAARCLQREKHCDVSMTLGALGNLQVWGDEAVLVPSHRVEPPIDIVGAGDTFLAAYCAALAAGASRVEAGQIGSLASEVTIAKLGTTGTASPAEVLARFDANQENDTNG